MATTKHAISLTVNGEHSEVRVEARRTLADVIREELGLTGTKLGCEHGVCGWQYQVSVDDSTPNCVVALTDGK